MRHLSIKEMVRFDSFFFFIIIYLSSYLPLSVLRERHMIQDRKKKIIEINLRLLKVKFGNRTIPSVVYPRLMQPQMLQLSILVLSERLHLQVLYYGSILLHQYQQAAWGKKHYTQESTTRKLCYKLPLSLSGSGLTRMVGTTNIHLVRTLDTRITIEDC